jgi:hypothetical protein
MWRVGAPLAGPGIGGSRIGIPGRSAICRIIGNLSLSLVIPIQPMRRRGGKILDRMEYALWDKHFVAWFCNDFFTTDGQP